MSIKDKKLRVRLNLQINEETLKMSNILREKHHVNISSLCREAIVKMYEKLENENNQVNQM